MTGVVDAIAPWAIERALVGAAVLCVVGATALLLRGRLSAHTASRLWLIPLAPFALPFDVGLRIDATRATPVAAARDWLAASADVAPNTPHRPAVPPGSTAPGATRSPTVAPDAPAPRRGVPLRVWLVATWAAVAVVLAGWALVAQRRVGRLVRDAADAPPALAETVAALARDVAIRRPIRARVTDALHSPATTGWLRPVVLVPRPLLDRLATAELRWVLLHELAHVRRGDVPVAALQQAVQIAWWWHPAVWVANGRVARHRECACDDAAAALVPRRERAGCARAFLEVVAHAAVPARALPNLLSMSDHKTELRRRLMRLKDLDRPLVWRLSGRATTALIALAAGVVALGVPNAPSAQERPVPAADATDAAAEPVRAIRGAAAWLVARQARDGGWRLGDGKKTIGIETEVSTTAIAALALMDAARFEPSADAAAAARRGIAWLLGVQTDDGCIGPRIGSAWLYGHAMATHALLAAHRVAPDAKVRAAIERAVAFILRAQNTRAGWRYGIQDGDNDSKMTSLMLLALSAARDLGIAVPERAVTDGRALVAKLTDARTGRIGWLERGGAPGRLKETWKTFPAEHSEEVTALGCVMWLDADLPDRTRATLAKSIHRVVETLPERAPGRIDYTYWFWGARLLADAEGAPAVAWRRTLDAALLESVRFEGGAASWPLRDAWSLPGLDVYSTATCLRALAALRE